MNKNVKTGKCALWAAVRLHETDNGKGASFQVSDNFFMFHRELSCEKGGQMLPITAILFPNVPKRSRTGNHAPWEGVRLHYNESIKKNPCRYRQQQNVSV
jgi:hypothetical protein